VKKCWKKEGVKRCYFMCPTSTKHHGMHVMFLSRRRLERVSVSVWVKMNISEVATPYASEKAPSYMTTGEQTPK